MQIVGSCHFPAIWSNSKCVQIYSVINLAGTVLAVRHNQYPLLK